MKLLPIILILVLTSCGASKNKASNTDTVLFKEYSNILNSDVEIILLKSADINCKANIIQLNCDNINAKELNLIATNGEVTLRLLDDKSYYFTPTCNGKKSELIVRHQSNGKSIVVATVSLQTNK